MGKSTAIDCASRAGREAHRSNLCLRFTGPSRRHNTPRGIIMWGILMRDGVGISGAPMQTTWHYRTTTSCRDAVSGGSGVASCTRFISTATVGYYVSITVEFSYQGQRYLAQTGFIPQGGYPRYRFNFACGRRYIECARAS